MMKTKAFIPVIMFFALALFPASAPGEAITLGDKVDVSSSASLGAQFHDTLGERTTQFEAYRDVPEGFVFDGFRFFGEYNDPAHPYYLRFDGRDILQDDQDLRLEFGRYGNFRLSFEWEESPRLYSRGDRSLWTDRGNGVLTIPDATQSTLEGTPFTVFDPSNSSTFRTTLAGFVDDASTVDLEVQRRTGTVEYLQKLAPGLHLRLNYMHEDKDGHKIASTGVYERLSYDSGLLGGPSTSGEPGERWRLTFMEVPEPVDYDTDSVGLSLELARKNWFANFRYSFQQFTNNISTLSFDNPFNLVPVDATGTPSRRGIATGVFVQDLPPDSTSHTGTLSGGIDLPFMDASLRGTVSVGGTWQDDPFLPFSSNPALTVGVPGGDATDPALLPQRGLDGAILTFVQNYVLTMRPVEPLRVTGKYRYYYYDNKTDAVAIPGFSELIDAQWEDAAALVHLPATPSYLRQDGDVEVEYDVTDSLSARADYGWERWRRWQRSVAHTDEHKVGGGFTVKPAGWVNVLADYHYSNRDGDAYTPTTTGTGTENATARMWDQSDRSRHAVDARVMLMPMDSLDFTLAGSYLNDSYNTDRLGLDSSYTWIVAADASYMPTDFITLTANYTHEDSTYELLGGSKTSAVDGVLVGGSQFSDPNRYDTDLDDRVDSFGAGISGVAVPDVLEFGLYYNFSRGKGKILTVNPNPRVADDGVVNGSVDSINSSQALPFDDTKTTSHELSAELVYRFLKHFALNLKYTYENFKLDDFAWTGMDNQEDQVTQDGVVVQDLQRALFLNSQYGDYDAHVGSVTLSYNF